jgi:hypothetical protein
MATDQWIAISRSYRKHYEAVLQTLKLLTAAGLIVTSPKGFPNMREGIPFVR